MKKNVAIFDDLSGERIGEENESKIEKDEK
jgi:hypothetical protein